MFHSVNTNVEDEADNGRPSAITKKKKKHPNVLLENPRQIVRKISLIMAVNSLIMSNHLTKFGKVKNCN